MFKCWLQMEEQLILILQCLHSSNMFQQLRNAVFSVGPSGKLEYRANIAPGTQRRPAADHAAAHCCDPLTTHSPALSRNQRPGCVLIQSAKVAFLEASCNEVIQSWES